MMALIGAVGSRVSFSTDCERGGLIEDDIRDLQWSGWLQLIAK
jgi:hypothetical protein